MLFSILALLGLTAVVAGAPTLYLIFRVVGALYHIRLGWRIWRGAAERLAEIAPYQAAAESQANAFFRGLLTQLSNPKTAVVYGSVFAALLPPHLPRAAALTMPVLVFALETSWYALVAVILSAAGPRAAYLRAKTTLDRIAGGVMTLLGAKLLYDAMAGGRH
jgi:threonine/homoserine/homoserine lactone efflux protein